MDIEVDGIDSSNGKSDCSSAVNEFTAALGQSIVIIATPLSSTLTLKHFKSAAVAKVRVGVETLAERISFFVASRPSMFAVSYIKSKWFFNV